MIFKVPAIEVSDFWGSHIRPFLKENDYYTISSIHISLMTGAKDVWLVVSAEEPQAVMIADFRMVGGHNVYSIFYLGGKDMNSWIDELSAAVISHCKSKEVRRIQALVRDGLVRKLLERGWDKINTMVELKL